MLFKRQPSIPPDLMAYLGSPEFPGRVTVALSRTMKKNRNVRAFSHEIGVDPTIGGFLLDIFLGSMATKIAEQMKAEPPAPNDEARQ